LVVIGHREKPCCLSSKLRRGRSFFGLPGSHSCIGCGTDTRRGEASMPPRGKDVRCIIMRLQHFPEAHSA
jgi:hypothetical protein